MRSTGLGFARKSFVAAAAVPGEPRAQQAVEVCYVAKVIRDDLAHMRAPRLETTLKLIFLMEEFLAA